MFRRQPLNYNNHPTTVGPHNTGILFGIRQTPSQYGGDNNVAPRREFWRTNTTVPVGKWNYVSSSSDVTAAKKRAAIGTGSLYSSDGAFSTKRSNVNDVRHTVRKMRSSGSVGKRSFEKDNKK
jgi:hypothetical protein